MSMDYSDIIQMMEKGGEFRFYRAKTKATDPNRMQALWRQILFQRIQSRDNAIHCCFVIKVQEKYAVSMDDITDLSDLIQMDYPGDIIWDYENINGEDVILEIIG